MENAGRLPPGRAFSLLSFQEHMYKDVMEHPDALLILGQGMGLHRLLLSILRVHCDPRSLVLVINANSTTAELVTEELDMITNYKPTIISTEQLSANREDIYLAGGIIFVTSRILVVDILKGRIQMDRITGIVVAEAHRVLPTTTEAFILRLFRHANRVGFIKALSDSPQSFRVGFNTLEKVMRSLWVSKLFLWPRFEQRVMSTLSLKQPRTFQVKVHMTKLMQLMQMSIADLMTSCLNKLKTLRPSLEMEFLSIERGLFPSFEQALRSQLDPVWHTLGSRTRQLVNDLRTLRTMAKNLDQYDAVSFYHYLETLRVGATASSVTCEWLALDAADDLFVHARNRVFKPRKTAKPNKTSSHSLKRAKRQPAQLNPSASCTKQSSRNNSSNSENYANKKRAASSIGSSAASHGEQQPMEHEIKVLAHMPADVLDMESAEHPHEGDGQSGQDGSDGDDTGAKRKEVEEDEEKEDDDDDDGDDDEDEGEGEDAASQIRNSDGIELSPKWSSLIELLNDLEGASERFPLFICVRDQPTANQIAVVLEKGQDAVLQYQLQRYRKWKVSVGAMSDRGVFGEQSVAQRRLGRRAARIARRRQRVEQQKQQQQQEESRDDQLQDNTTIPELIDLGTEILEERDEFDDSQAEGQHHGLDMAVAPDEDFRCNYQVIARSHTTILLPMHLPDLGVSTTRFARMLSDFEPKTIIFYDMELGCLREVESYQSIRPDINIEVRLMVYQSSFQEQSYLSSIRHEKEAFERMIQSKRVMALPADQDGRRGIRQQGERQLKSRVSQTISSRKGGGRVLEQGAPRPKVIVDMREFRSSLPSLIHDFGMDVIPVTLLVGDYVLSPDICVERKSLPDLIGSLNSGRLYHQVQEMTTHYTRPALLIEFDESKPFSLLGANATLSDDIEFKNTMSKLTLLTLSFPTLRLLWSRSPYATAELFYVLKQHHTEPDEARAASVGEHDVYNEEDYALEPMTVLKAIPGVTAHNVYSLMAKAKNLQELSQMSLKALQEVAGRRSGRLIFKFFANSGEPPAELNESDDDEQDQSEQHHQQQQAGAANQRRGQERSMASQRGASRSLPLAVGGQQVVHVGDDDDGDGDDGSDGDVGDVGDEGEAKKHKGQRGSHQHAVGNDMAEINGYMLRQGRGEKNSAASIRADMTLIFGEDSDDLDDDADEDIADADTF
eukprot:m.69795 g.69795  ORF g.69795 m.69795 type:complete len:1181 (-) comp13750_c0_seq8:1060-4602(-)